MRQSSIKNQTALITGASSEIGMACAEAFAEFGVHLGLTARRLDRFYSPWDIAANPQAKNTQGWQLLYFFEIDPNKPLDVARVSAIFSQ